MRANQDLREQAQSAGVYLWQIANAIGMNDGNFSRKLRKELSDDEKSKIYRVIKELSRKEA